MADTRPAPRLMLVTDRRRTRLPLPELVAAVAGGVDTVQLREPDLATEALVALAMELKDVIGDRAELLINRDLEVAARLGTGAHLPESGPDPVTARQRLGPEARLGRSVHSPGAAAQTTGVDYLLAGHVYPTISKPGQPALGLDGLRRIVAASRTPVLAIGGITPARVAAALATGTAGIAVIGAIAEAEDPQGAAGELRAAVDHVLEEQMGQSHAVEAGPEITVTINGKPVALPEHATITEFITGKGLTAEMVIVELNGEIVPRPSYPTTTLRAGDRLEVVHAVGGG